MAAENQTHDYYMTVGPMFSDPMARQLYAEIASIEEQHVTQYESMIDPQETWIEKWLLHELTEVYNYWSCVEQETNARLKKIWERGLDYELGHLHYVMDLMRQLERRDPYELLPATLPAPIVFASQRQFVRDVLENEVDLRAKGAHFIAKQDEGPADASVRYRQALNRHGSPSETVAANYVYRPGTELSRSKQSAA
jgi:rubrerythrin